MSLYLNLIVIYSCDNTTIHKTHIGLQPALLALRAVFLAMKKIKLIKWFTLRFAKTTGFAGLVYISGAGGVQAELPVVHPTIPWSSNVRITQQTDNLLRIGQNQGRSGNWILNWQSFNVSEGSRVKFDQPSATHIALNRIYQNDASKIMGSIDANGRIYLINQNGFTFGKKSTINVNSLVASSLALNMNDSEFIAGTKNISNLINGNQSAFDIDAFKYKFEDGVLKEIVDVANFTDPATQTVNKVSQSEVKGIKIEGEYVKNDKGEFVLNSVGDKIINGAKIYSQPGGNILMFAPTIENSGEISTKSGQVILAAAKDRVYLTPSQDPALRGFLVEVKTGGSVTNLGKILAERGNITLAGFAINQGGVLEATTSVNENGSIRLLARHGARFVNSSSIDNKKEELILGIDLTANKITRAKEYIVAGETGTVQLLSGSKTRVLIEADDETLITDVQNMQASRVEITGNKILVKANAQIVAQGGRVIKQESGKDIVVSGGEVVLHATSNALQTATDDDGGLRNRDNSVVVLESGSRVDVSGVDVSAEPNEAIDMKRNELKVTLTGNFLRDAPLQRDSVIRNESVYLDIRDGTPLGDISNLVASNVKRGINEIAAAAGTLDIISQGGVLLEQGSEVDVSGGAIAYADGYVTSSQFLTETGRLIDVADADPNLAYSAIFGTLTVESKRWGKAGTRKWSIFGGSGNGVSRFYQGYVEGKDAGSLNIKTHTAVTDNSLLANTVNGIRQRDGSQRAAGGNLNITLGGASDVTGQAVLLSSVRDGEKITEDKMAAFLNSDKSVADWDLVLVNSLTADSGIQNLKVVTNGGNISVDKSANTNLATAGKLTLSGRTLEVNNDIRIVSGEVKITAQDNLTLTGIVDTSGNWVNDRRYVDGRDLRQSVGTDGGSIKLASSGGKLLLADSKLKANGGAWLQSDGKLLSGDGGSIKLSVSSISNAAADIELGRYEAYSAARGGKLSITANQINIANTFSQPADIGELQFTPDFFQRGGFSDFTLISNANDLTLHADTQIAPQTQSLVFDSFMNIQSSADSIRSITEVSLLPAYATPTSNLNLITNSSGPSSTAEGLLINETAKISLTPGSDLNLSADNKLIMRGVIEAPGGDVNLTLNTDGLPYVADSAIWFDGSIITNGNFTYNAAGELLANSATFIKGAENDQGLILGQVLDSGTVSFTANSGYIINSADSLIDVSGTVHGVDLPSVVVDNTVVEYQRQQVSGEAGDIKFTAAEGMYLAGVLNAQAAAVDGASGGGLSVVLRTNYRSSLEGVTGEGRQIRLVQSESDMPGNGVAGQNNYFSTINLDGRAQSNLLNNVSDTQIGKAWLSADKIKNAGFDHLRLEANNTLGEGITLSAANTGAIVFQDNIDLTMAQSLQLIAPIIRADGVANSRVNLAAPYVLMGTDGGSFPHKSVVASSGNSVLNIQAGINGVDGLLDVSGIMYLQGISDVNLSSEGDIRLRGIKTKVTLSTELLGSLTSFSDMTLQADQVYATTLSQFDVNVAGDANGVLKIKAAGEASPILSAASVLSLTAPIIQQAGVLKAPLGQININASQQIAFSDNSVTSVSAEGQIIPFGNTTGEERWVYSLVDDPRYANEIEAPLGKEINVQSDDIKISPNAVFDISGGGDLSSWEFVPGLGGSVDSLLSENANGAFAVIPGNPTYAAFDFKNWQGEKNIKVGEQIYLGGNSGLSEGLYTVLPARYALLPGAYLVTPTAENLLPSQQFTRLDGAPIVPGQKRVAGSEVHDNLWSAYVIESSDAVRQRSEYFETTASQFFRDASQRNNTLLPSMPEDGGTLSILAGSKLQLAGILKGDAASVDFKLGNNTVTAQGRGALLNISADNLRIVSATNNTTNNTTDIVISDASLNAFNASSILLGGTRQRTADGLDVTTLATNIVIDEGAYLQVPELLLVATDNITVKQDASIIASGETSNADPLINVQGDGALLRASVNDQVRVNRSNESAAPTRGVITIEQGVTIDALKSIVFDSSKDLVFENISAVNKPKGKLNVNGGSLTLASNKISLGDVSANDNVTGISFSKAEIEAINVKNLVLSSRSGIDLYGSINLNVNSLEFEAGGFNVFQNANETFSINAVGDIKLSNASAYSAGTASANTTGTLQLKARNIKLATGDIDVTGLSELNLLAEENILTQGKGSLNVKSNASVLLDGRITASSDSNYKINADQSSLMTQRSAISELKASESLGGKLSINAATLTHSGQIDMASGYLNLNALGANGDVILTNGSIINLSGIERDFAGEAVYTPGGSLSLSSALADIQINNGALVDVSSSGNAGAINLKAKAGTINVSGQLRAQSGANSRSGSFSAESFNFDELSKINQQLNKDFNQRRYIHLGEGDITLAANESIVAKQVSLQTDNGSIDISGTIDASGSKGGKVHLAAQNSVAQLNDVIVNVSGNIKASATSDDGEGGDVYIESRGANGMIDVSAAIDVSGGVNSRGGKIHIRAPRTAANDGININSLAINKLTGFRRLDIEAYESYSILNNIDVTKFSGVGEYKVAADTFMANSNAILTGLGINSQPNVHLRAGVELNSPGDISLNSDLDLLKSLTGNEAGILSLRAAGNVNINATLQDGFIVSGALHKLQSGESWSYNIVAGADTNAASVSALSGENNSSDIILANNALIRTGKGDIKMQAANNVSMGVGAAIYTGGNKTEDLSLYQEIRGRRGSFRFIDNQIVSGLEFPEDGGDVSIVAGGDLSAPSSSSLLVTDWLYRVGPNHVSSPETGALPNMTGVGFAGFTNGVAALGGGDINIEIAGNIDNVAVSVPSIEKYTGNVDITLGGGRISKYNFTGTQTVQAGRGDINVAAGGDINQSLFFAANGEINVSASGNIGNVFDDSGIYLVTADKKASVFAGGDLFFQGVSSVNLMPFSQAHQNLFGSNSSLVQFQNYYSDYTQNSAIELTSLSGLLEIRNTAGQPFSSAAPGGLYSDFLSIYPGDLRAVAIDGSLNLKNNITLWPSASGGVSLLAENNLTAFNDGISLSIKMFDFAPEDLPGKLSSVTDPTGLIVEENYQEINRLLHLNDNQASRFIANKGDISATSIVTPFEIITNEQTELYAGRDILGIKLRIQNNAENNISSIQAGRDIRHINSLQEGINVLNNGIEISGPGELHVLAGRDINLGDQLGIIATANSKNTLLSNSGAQLLIMAGLGEKGADYNAFIEQYFTADSEYAGSLIEFMNKQGAGLLNFAESLNQFKLLDEKQQRTLVVAAFSNEYSQSAVRAAKEQTQDPAVDDGEILGYTRGIEAIDTLFPGTIQSQRSSVSGEITGGDLIVTGGTTYIIADVNPMYSGNVSMVASTIQTIGDNADISILAPGGFLNVGLSVSTENNKIEKGIITKGDGEVNLFTQGNISVNQSRVQALNGGNISGWSTKGDIDAGRGAKDALVLPPPRTVVDLKTGTITQVFDAAVQGNGIRTACSDADCITADEFKTLAEQMQNPDDLNNIKRAGGVVLGAPAGVIDAGDAGINSGGGLILATDTVLNANQIKAAGDSTGVPADASALGADLGGMDVNSSGEDAATELVASDVSDQFGAGSVAILQVEIMGLSDKSRTNTQPTPKVKNNKANAQDKRDKSKDQVDANQEKLKSLKPDLSMN